MQKIPAGVPGQEPSYLNLSVYNLKKKRVNGIYKSNFLNHRSVGDTFYDIQVKTIVMLM